MSEHIANAIANWLPYKLVKANETDCCKWLFVGDTPFTAPFFDETISACRSLPQNSTMRSSISTIDVLPRWGAAINSASPTAIIFHISRCGSTLVSQLLALQQANIVLSEVPFFDELLRLGIKDSEVDASTLLRAAVQLYGARRNEKQQRLFIKTDSWHIHFYQQLRALYPAVPFVLLYRRPDEVLRSQQKNRGMHAVPGVVEPQIFGLEAGTVTHMNFDEYMAKVIEGYLEKFAQVLQTDTMAFAVNYNQGALAIVQKIATATGMPISNAELEGMQQRAGFHAKYPGQVFEEPPLQQAIPSYLIKAFELYEQVEAMRKATVVAG